MFPVLFSFGPISISSYFVCSILALMLGIFVFWKRGREEYFSEHDVLDMVFMSSLWAFVFGRGVYIFSHLSDFGINLYYWIAFWSVPGIVWQGSLIGGLMAIYKFSVSRRWNLFKALDLVVMGLSLSHFWLNLGAFLSGSVVGKTTSLFLGVEFPGSFEKRHPVNLYASIMWLGMFVFLWWVENKYRRFVWYQRSKGDARPGFLFFFYLVGLGLIGFIAKLFTEIGTKVYGIDPEVLTRLVILVIGLAGLYLRSGLSVKSGVDDVFSGFMKSFDRKKRKKSRY